MPRTLRVILMIYVSVRFDNRFLFLFPFNRYHDAETSIQDRNTLKLEVVKEILESELELLGLTGVEDKLQDGVKTTLELLRNAGLKIWMLTGVCYAML